jgi:monoamine oxidase
MAKTPAKKTGSCIVIGAGLSGLAAAHALTKEGWEVTVLEANAFTGGRVYSFRFPEAPDLVCELGGEWVGDDHESMIALCQEFGLELIPHRFDFFFFEKGKRGRQYDAGEWPFESKSEEDFNKLKEKVLGWKDDEKARVFDRKDWWTILRDFGFNDCDLLRRDLMDSTDFGETIRQTGGYSAAAEYFESDDFDEMDMKIAGGNHKLIDALEGAIKSRQGRILRGHVVSGIEQPKDVAKVKVRTADGEEFEAAYCICTVPARTLTKIDFHPKLPDDQWDAAKQLQYCRIMKTAILCETRFWMESANTKFSCFSDETSDFVFDATLRQPGGMGILCSYAIGDKADDLNGYPLSELKAKIQTDLRRIFPDLPVSVVAIQKQAWQSNTLTEGAYGFYRPGQWFTVREKLAKHFERVYFAGEHIAEEQGFMEGAVDTGHIAARKVMAARRGGGDIPHRD